MRRLLAYALLALALPQVCLAVPMYTAERGAVPARPMTLAEDEFLLWYHNFCCGWVFYWSGYCYTEWFNLLPQYGTCFDLADCPGGCRHLTDVWWACKRFTPRGGFDLEIYCANEYGCPVGPPLAGAYYVAVNVATAWQHVSFDSLELCPCDLPFGKFLVLVTQLADNAHMAPYSDINSYNVVTGCETDWRCTGHSFVYRSGFSYCDVYGIPGAMWVSGQPWYECTNPPTVPVGCMAAPGFFTEFLVYCSFSCQGPTEAARESWSAVKALYR